MRPFLVLGLTLALFHSFSAGAATIATVNGEVITEEEVMKKANSQLLKINTQIYEVKKDVVLNLIEDKLLNAEAKKLGKTPSQLIQEAQAKVAEPTDAEAQTIFTMQKDRMFPGKTFEDVKVNIKNQLRQQKRNFAVQSYLEGLRKSATVKINLERPAVQVSVDDDPSQGPTDAKVTLIEFSDFQCPYCKRARPTLDKILAEYKGKVRYVFRDFPLSFHKEATPAAKAANCAGEQKKYWEYNAKMFEKSAQLNAEVYPAAAKELGLDLAAFNSCLASDKYNKEIDKDMADLMAIGVGSTPSYFINGKYIAGAQPFEAFKEIIDEELAK